MQGDKNMNKINFYGKEYEIQDENDEENPLWNGHSFHHF
jgi:hypothetical protein